MVPALVIDEPAGGVDGSARGKAEIKRLADKSAVGAVNRPLLLLYSFRAIDTCSYSMYNRHNQSNTHRLREE